MPLNFIASTTLSSAAVSIVFTDIPQDYSDLLVTIAVRTASTSGSGVYTLGVRPRTSTGTDFTAAAAQRLWATSDHYTSAAFAIRPAASASLEQVGGAVPGGRNGSSNIYSNAEIYIWNYSQSGVVKPATATGVAESTYTGDYNQHIHCTALRWSNTDAIHSLFFTSYENMQPTSTIQIYGVD